MFTSCSHIHFLTPYKMASTTTPLLNHLLKVIGYFIPNKFNKFFSQVFIHFLSAEILLLGTFSSYGLCDTIFCLSFYLSENFFSHLLHRLLFLPFLLYHEDSLICTFFASGNSSSTHMTLPMISFNLFSLHLKISLLMIPKPSNFQCC